MENNFERFQFIQIVHDVALKALTDENTPKLFFKGFLIHAHKFKTYKFYTKFFCSYIEQLTKELERLNLVDYCFEVYRNDDIKDKAKVIMSRIEEFWRLEDEEQMSQERY